MENEQERGRKSQEDEKEEKEGGRWMMKGEGRRY